MNKDYLLKKLAIFRPSALTKNSYDLIPNEFNCLNELVYICNVHGEYKQKATKHIFEEGCPGCIKEFYTPIITTDEFIKQSKAKYGNIFNYEKTLVKSKHSDVVITCPKHGDTHITPIRHLYRTNSGCEECHNELRINFLVDNFINKAIQKHNSKYSYDKVIYKTSQTPVEITCPKHGSFWMKLFNHSRGQGCYKCAREKDRLTLEDFITRSRQKHGDKYDYSKVIYRTGNDKVTIICKKHGEFIQRASSHLEGVRCKHCYIEDSWTDKEEFIKNARKVHGDKYDYSKVKYIGSKRKVEIICPHHGSYWVIPNAHISSKAGCRVCMESRGEKAIELCLNKYNIKRIREYKIKPYNYRYDFYLPDYNIYIEYNGQQHYFPIEMFGGEKQFEICKQNDAFKKDLVKCNNGYLIIISYQFNGNEVIEKELIRRLKNIYSYWFIVNNEVKAYKTAMDVCKAFNISSNILVRNLARTVENSVSGVRVLF